MPSYRTPDRVQLNYREAGATGPALILIHGWGSRLDHWQPIVAPLAKQHRVLRLDLRGHGRSEAPEDGYSMWQFADDTAALARSRRIRSAVIVGHSMGSTVALELARRHPRLVRGVVMVDGAVDQFSTARDLEGSALWKSLAERPHEEAMTELYSAFFPDPRDAVLAERVVADAVKTPPHAALASWRATLTANIPTIAAGVRQPVLYVDGGHGRRPAEAVHRVLPHAAFAQAALCGHFVQLEVPDQLVAMIRRFVERLDAV
ncbi:MAG: alpha/beta hydrolase [Chloroflexi bacterium]|nr:alpha/beta hydrolase [Chloroflexota bacterium]MDA1147648.1 alpha/beta hydrolase [Chloroflexota bacterium]